LCALLATLLFSLALRGRYPLWPLAYVHGALALSYLPWLATLLAQYGRGEVWIARPRLARLVKPYAAMSNDQLPWLLALLLVGAAAGALLARTRGEPLLGLRGAGGRAVLLALAWALVPTLVAFAISRLLLPVFTERNLIVALPGVLLLAALALDAIERSWFRGVAVASLLAVGLLAYDLVAVRDYYSRPTKHQFREAALRVMQGSAGAEQPPLIVADVWYASYFDYYFRALGSSLRVGAVPRTLDHRGIVARTRPRSLFCLEIAGKRRGRPRPPLCVYDGYRETQRWRLHGWTVHQLRPRD
jgi:hypothetical protein